MSINLLPNLSIYKYVLLRKLGNGQFGQVWLAKDLTIDLDVALKVLDSSFQPIVQILDEARIGNKFNHYNLLKILYADITVFEERQIVLIAQEFHPKGSISNKLNSFNFLPLPEVIKFICDILCGLEHLHHQGFYHNDIKPSNILIGANNEGILADYGISGFSPDGNPIAPKNAYKIHRAPETANDNPVISVLSDIYQVGMTAFRLLNGISFVSSDFQALGEEKFEELKAKGRIPNKSSYQPFIPRAIRRVVNTALNVDSNQRYQSALEMRRALEKCSFPGYWTSDERGQLVGIGQKYKYRFEKNPRSGQRFEVLSFKKNLISGRETRISSFSGRNLPANEATKLISCFYDWVVLNAD